MTTTIAYTMTLFSGAVLLLAAMAWGLLRRRPEARRAAQRIGVTFAVFALAAGYVWIELGPEVDHQLQVRGRPLLPDQSAREFDV